MIAVYPDYDYPLVKRDLGCFTTFLSRLRDEGDHASMKFWYEILVDEMYTRNIIPDKITMTIMISAAPTVKVSALMMESFLKNYPDVVKRDPGCFNALLTRLRDEHDCASMDHWWQEMRKRNIIPDDVTQSVVMSAAPTAEAAVRLMESFLSDYPDEVNLHLKCFTALLSRLRDERDYAKMQHWWQEMRKRKISPDGVSLSTMMSATCSFFL